MTYFKPKFRTEAAPYGLEDAAEIAKLPCPAGYLACGFITMNKDLQSVCGQLEEARERAELLEKKVDMFRVHLAKIKSARAS